MPSCGLIPANELNFTKLFAFFLPRDTVFFRSLSATIFQVKFGPSELDGCLR
jgi:hypothetical protein